MSQPQQVPDSGEPGSIPSPSAPGRASFAAAPAADENVARAREQAEAEAAVLAVMQRVREKAEAAEHARPLVERRFKLKGLLLLALVVFNLYAWFGNPEWLRFREPMAPSVDYYQASWEMAVYLQRERIEEYRHTRGYVPKQAKQAGPVVKGVRYTPIREQWYDLSAGDGPNRFVFHSTDSLSVLVRRALVQVGLFAGGVR